MVAMIKLAVLGIIVTMFCVYFKGKQPEIAAVLALVCCITIFAVVLQKMDVIVQAMNQLQSYIKIKSDYMKILLKIIGITYVAEFSSGICKDAGYKAIGDQIELVGKLTIIAISMPIVLALIETINDFLTI